MSNQLGENPAQVVSVALQKVDAIRLHAHRKEYRHPMPVIVMAGVTALEEGVNPEYSWFNRLMGATCRKSPVRNASSFAIEFVGDWFVGFKGDNFVVRETFDTFSVKKSDESNDFTYYAGTRHNCELVAAHLNKILREEEEKVSNE